MKGFGYEKRSSNGLKKIGLILSFPFIILIIGFTVYKLFLIPEPVIEGLEAFKSLPLEKSITLNGNNIKFISIFISQKGSKIELLRDTPEIDSKTYTLQVKPKILKLLDGPAKVTVKARSGILKEVNLEINTIIDTVPPSLNVVNSPSFIDQGSGGFAVLRAKDADSVYLSLDGRMFTAFKAAPGTAQESILTGKTGGTEYHVFFPAPLDVKEGSIYYAVAEDIAGNQNVKSLFTKFRTKTFKTSSINIDESFINTVVASLLGELNIPDPVKAFSTVNEGWREDSLKMLNDITKDTIPEVLWEGRFLQLKNSKVMATYGDRRTYHFKGEPISRSVHLGYDLASISNAPVEASNTGVVRFSGEIGIYGNTVVIDHGLGLMSLYGHLSTIMVKDGESVEKGDIIAKTGSTGLAGGDHLHFGILIHGYEVSPLYWWDSRWIKSNILDRVEN